jgi:hypothetical protein
MARRCGTCYLEAQPGDKLCRRCGANIEPRDLTWLYAALILLAIALAGGAVGFFMKQ